MESPGLPHEDTRTYVFLSYASDDRSRALALAEALERRGVAVWIDRRSIVGGTSWSGEIVQAIEGCAAVLLLCSAASVTSRNVRQEVQLAWETERPIVPLMLEPVQIAESIRYALVGRQWLELHGRPEEGWLPDLLQALARLHIRPQSAVTTTRVDPDASPGLRCPACQAVAASGARFCGQCGNPLAAPADRPGAVAPERRNLTVLALEFVAASGTGELDAEDFAAAVSAAREAVMPVLVEHGGTPAPGVHQGLTAYFGYPNTHEDDARRAARAALAIVDAVDHVPQRDVRACVAIHTGVAIVAGERERETVIGGDVPSLASALLAHSGPGSVVVSAPTRRVIDGFFQMEDLGPRRIQGRPNPIPLFRVARESDVRSRLDVAARRGLSPLIGRQAERTLLQGCWERVRGGEGQVVLLVGEAGIGKSRLTYDLRAAVMRDPDAWTVVLQCSEVHQQSPLFPVIDVLERQVLGLRDGATADEKATAVRELLAANGRQGINDAFLLGALLGVPATPDVPMQPDRQRQATLDLLLELVLARAERQSVLLVCEDLHWADPSTLELLTKLVAACPGVRTMLVATSRPGIVLPWASRPHVTTVSVGRLSSRQAGDLVDELLAGRTLPDRVRQQVIAKADGVPLFVEELMRSVMEEGDREHANGPGSDTVTIRIPETVQDLLLARLDGLGDAREVAQLGATLGREFSFDVLDAIAPWGTPWLRQALARLVDADVLQHRGLPSQATYVFRHALIRDAAYGSMVRERRREFHRRAAMVLADRLAGGADGRPEVVAHHFTEAGDGAHAAAYWLEAGQRAMHAFANAEAVAHLQRGLTLLEELPEDVERMQAELGLRMALGVTLMATRGFAAPEVQAAFNRARELCQAFGDTPQLAPALSGLWTFYVVRADMDEARAIADQQMRLAEGMEDEGLRLQALQISGVTAYFMGEFNRARSLLEDMLNAYDPDRYAEHAYVYGHEPASAALSYLSMTLCVLGFPDTALERSREGIELGTRINHPLSLARNLCEAAVLRQMRREPEETRTQAQQGVAHSSEHGIVMWKALGTAFLGWATAASGDPGAGVELLRQGIGAYRASGAQLGVSTALGYLAEALGLDGKLAEALSAIDEALGLAERTKANYFLAEAQRLKGTLLLQDSQDEAGERMLRAALDTARGQGARWLALRAGTNLAWLWHTQGRDAAARGLLDEVLEGLTEGGNTADMRAARELEASLPRP